MGRVGGQQKKEVGGGVKGGGSGKVVMADVVAREEGKVQERVGASGSIAKR